MVMVEAPRVRVCQRLPQAAAPPARQSTPLCSWKRLSSDEQQRVAQGRRHARQRAPIARAARVVSVRTGCSTGIPWRSAGRVSEERQPCWTWSKFGSGAAVAATQAATARRGQRASRVGARAGKGLTAPPSRPHWVTRRTSPARTSPRRASAASRSARGCSGAPCTRR